MTTIAPTKSLSIASQLSKEDLAEGHKVIACLGTVVDMRRLGIPDNDIVEKIFRDDIYTDYQLSRYARKFDRYDEAAQKAFVRELLSKS